PSQEVLQEVLADYAGTILLVSHDRYLIDALATQIWEIDEAKNTLRVFKGTYSEYHTLRENEREAEKTSASAARKGEVETHLRSNGRTTPEEKRRKARLKEVELLIHSLEENLRSLSSRLETPPADPAKVQRWGTEYVRVQGELDELMKEWEVLVSSEQ
ncbi:MAG: hypothetical protein EHM41_22095, partial [Chloroflexi bacterium]